MKLRTSLAGCCLLATTAYSMELNPMFQDSAVLQCDSRVPVWGTGRDGEKISVTFAGQTVSAVVSNGAWKVWLAPMKPNATPQTLTATHTGGGLVTKDGELKGFTIAGEDKNFHPAEAKVVGDTVVVSSPQVEQPTAVRYGWADVPEGNLFNRADLPTSPFRADAN